MFQSKEQVYSASMNPNVSDCEFEKITDKENSKASKNHQIKKLFISRFKKTMAQKFMLSK